MHFNKIVELLNCLIVDGDWLNDHQQFGHLAIKKQGGKYENFLHWVYGLG